MADLALADLQATALTQRCHNAFFRQKQLKSLHDALRKETSAIKDAIKQDTPVSDAEATAEVALALDIVKEHYSSIDPKKELDEEYQIVNGKDASERRDPWGVVYIELQPKHTPFYSTIVALAAALAAGNCVTLKVSHSRRGSGNETNTVSSRTAFVHCRHCFARYFRKHLKEIPLPSYRLGHRSTRLHRVSKFSKIHKLRAQRTHSWFRRRAKSSRSLIALPTLLQQRNNW
jgi:hypothetical protein